MFRRAFIALIVIGCITGIGAANADVLLIEEVRERLQRDLPGNGMTKNEVRQRYGEPDQRHAPVGDPPITRWVYDDYSVYFEHDLVIESVLNRGAVLARNRPDD